MKQRLILLGIAIILIGGLVAFDRSQNTSGTEDMATSTVSTTTPPVATSTTATATPSIKPTPVPAPIPAPTPAPKPVPDPEPAQPLPFSRADVATHNSRTSCWTIIEDSVYDLTAWINEHPGGERAILSICGKDGTQAFTQQHGSSSRAKKDLASFFLAPLAD